MEDSREREAFAYGGSRMNRKPVFLLGAAAGAFVFQGGAQASDTTTYTYDPLGRLVAISTTGGPNNGLSIGTGYDPAGNRTTYTAGTGAPPPSPPPPPPPPPPPSNQPPVTAPDSLSVPQCGSGTRNVLANDSDPEGHYPLALVSVTQGTKGAASIINSTTIEYQANFATGPDTVTYTVQDSLGATSTGTLNISITSGTCD